MLAARFVAGQAQEPAAAGVGSDTPINIASNCEPQRRGEKETTETASCWTVNLEFNTFRLLTLLENILYSDNLFIEPAGTLVFFTQESGTMAWRR